MTDVFYLVQNTNSIAISGHIRPDGDCVGSCISMYNYLQDNFNQNNEKTIDVYLEEVPEEFKFLKHIEYLKHNCNADTKYDLFISLDCGSLDRLGDFSVLFQNAKVTINIDHHISNTKFGIHNMILPNASSTCEVLYDIFNKELISTYVAESLYLGIIHDTGVFKHSNTTEKTMQAAGRLISLGAAPWKIIDETFYQKTYVQNLILGRCLMESILIMDGKVIISNISKKIQDFYHIVPSDLDGVIDQLRVTKGIEVAIFLRESDICEYKVSMRSNGVVDVSKIAVFFGGGGHVKAAGCSMKGYLHDVINNLTAGIEHQLDGL